MRDPRHPPYLNAGGEGPQRRHGKYHDGEKPDASGAPVEQSERDQNQECGAAEPVGYS